MKKHYCHRFVLDRLPETLVRRREQREAADRAGSPVGSWLEGGDRGQPVAEDLIDPALRDEPATGQRRQRSDSTDDDPAQRKVKYARITEQTCDAYSLRSKKRLEVQDFSALDIHAKMIVLFAHAQGVSRDLAMRDVRSFATLGANTRHVARTTPRSNHINNFICGDITANWEAWKVGRSTVQDPDAMKELLRQLGNHLTGFQNEYKDILKQAERENWCINRLMNKLALESLYVSKKHRARWARIFSYYKGHRQQGAKENAFWSDLDKALLENEELLRLSQVDPCDSPYDAPNWQVTLEAQLARKHTTSVKPNQPLDDAQLILRRGANSSSAKRRIE
ncbi:hypothetical protein FRC10_007229 [Ceratobasidium sp. 414]|nr:hypothetical protein FRC10_007229 [Ceratobasidium sp. 414]